MNRLSKSGMGKGLILCILLLSLASFLGACSEKSAPPKPVAPVLVAQVSVKAIPYELTAIGNVVEYSSVNIKAQISGYLAKVHFQKGQFVNRSALLFTIDPRPFQATLAQAEGVLARDKAQLANAREDEKRYAELLKKGYISRQQYDQQRTTADALTATVSADQAAVDYARLQLDYCFLRSPIAGRTGDILIDEGNLIKANDDNKYLVTIKQIQPIYVSFSLPEKNLADIKKYSASRQLPVDVFLDKSDPKAEKGLLTFIDNTVDPATGMIKLKATLRNDSKRLWPGQFVNITLSLFTQKDAVVVPTEALQTGQAGQFVYVVKEDLTTELRPVSVNRTYGNLAVIDKGLAKGEQVVTDGQLRIIPGGKVSIKNATAAEQNKPAAAAPKKLEAAK